jgi:hypothetical protein
MKIFLMLASGILFAAAGAAQTPPANQGSLPQLPKPRQLLLEVDLKLDAGAASTKDRSVTLNFTAREKSDVGNVTIREVTANITHYRVRESPDLRDTDVSGQPWIPLERAPRGSLLPKFLSTELAERNGAGQRYGDRKVMFQVKTETLTSSVVSDTIVLEPVLKEYRVSPSGTNHPLIQYAADQGFTFPRDHYETCKGGNCPTQASENIANGSANVSLQGLIADTSTSSPGFLPGVVLATSAPAACVTKADYLLFEGRSVNPFWRIKSVDIPGAHVVFHGANKFRVKFSYENKSGVCSQTTLAVGEVVVEGPEADDFVDSANQWKNAFVREQGFTVRPIQPGIRPPN